MIQAADLIAGFRYALEQHWGYIYGTAGEMWTEAKQRELEKTTDADRKSSREYGAKWIGSIVTDCSGLLAKVFAQLGGYIYHGSNTIWNKYCAAKGELLKGTRTDGKPLRLGTAVFCCHNDRRTHVGLYVGNGDVIEASGVINGVITSKITNKKWVEWGELKGVQYEGDDNMPQKEDRPTLRKGSKGEYVTWLQTALINRGYSCGAWGADGSFGNATDLAVRLFQEAKGLTVDGIVGPKTWAALDAVPDAPAALTYTVTIMGLTKDQVTALLRDYPEADVAEERG